MRRVFSRTRSDGSGMTAMDGDESFGAQAVPVLGDGCATSTAGGPAAGSVYGRTPSQESIARSLASRSNRDLVCMVPLIEGETSHDHPESIVYHSNTVSSTHLPFARNQANGANSSTGEAGYTDNASSLNELAQQAARSAESNVHARPSTRSGHQNLIIVSNRLPLSVAWDAAAGSWMLTMSAGGLVSALLGVSQASTRWVGWPGQYVPDGPDQEELQRLLRAQKCNPVWMSQELLALHYNGFCNAVLWQLFHYVPVQMDFKLSETHTLEQQWMAYVQANHMFAEATLADYQDGDVVWIQDYHLMLMPGILKARCPTMQVGFFLHTPFPSSEIYRTLPYREQLLRGILKADLIGFHTYDYARHFISSCTRILGLEGTPYGVEENGTLIRVAAFPIGIDPLKFPATLQDPDVVEHVKYLKIRYGRLKVMLGVDRLDMIKGIPQKLIAFEKFLDEHEEYRQQVALIQIAVPSRLDVPEYQHLRSQVHEIVGRINGKYGTLTHVPIHHLDRSLSFSELCALYSITDVLLVTSLRDGMNLVSYEFVACQKDNHGVLVLSEFAGAAQSLGAGSILVNPWNINDMAHAIWEALTMSTEERYQRWKSNYAHISVHTAQMWADHFITELNETCANAQTKKTHQPPPLPLHEATSSYSSAGRRLIVLGYNAALTVSASSATRQTGRDLNLLNGTRSTVSKARVDSTIMRAIAALCKDPRNVVIVTSGATRQKLEAAFVNMDVWLAAENGVYLRPPPSLWPELEVTEDDEWLCLYENLNFSWVKSVEQVFEYFSERTPRSFVETRDTSVVWNYKHSDYEFGKSQAQDMLQHLLTGPISSSPVDVVRGSRSVEVRTFGVNKGISMSRIIEAMSKFLGVPSVAFDFVMCIGHFMSRDERIFSYFEGDDVNNEFAVAGGTDAPFMNPFSLLERQRGDTAGAAAAVAAGSVIDDLAEVVMPRPLDPSRRSGGGSGRRASRPGRAATRDLSSPIGLNGDSSPHPQPQPGWSLVGTSSGMRMRHDTIDSFDASTGSSKLDASSAQTTSTRSVSAHLSKPCAPLLGARTHSSERSEPVSLHASGLPAAPPTAPDLQERSLPSSAHGSPRYALSGPDDADAPRPQSGRTRAKSPHANCGAPPDPRSGARQHASMDAAASSGAPSRRVPLQNLATSTSAVALHEMSRSGEENTGAAAEVEDEGAASAAAAAEAPSSRVEAPAPGDALEHAETTETAPSEPSEPSRSQILQQRGAAAEAGTSDAAVRVSSTPSWSSLARSSPFTKGRSPRGGHASTVSSPVAGNAAGHGSGGTGGAGSPSGVEATSSAQMSNLWQALTRRRRSRKDRSRLSSADQRSESSLQGNQLLSQPSNVEASASIDQIEAVLNGTMLPPETMSARLLQELVFPPNNLYTVTVGRSRSLARFSVDGPRVVSHILTSLIAADTGGARDAAPAVPQPDPFEAAVEVRPRSLDEALFRSAAGAAGATAATNTTKTGSMALATDPCEVTIDIDEVTPSSAASPWPDTRLGAPAAERAGSRSVFTTEGAAVSSSTSTKLPSHHDAPQPSSTFEGPYMTTAPRRCSDAINETGTAAIPLSSPSANAGPYGDRGSPQGSPGFSFMRPSLSGLQSQRASVSLAREPPPPPPPPEHVGGCSTLFDAMGRPVPLATPLGLAHEAAAEPLMIRRRAESFAAGGAGAVSSAAQGAWAAAGRNLAIDHAGLREDVPPFEPMYEREPAPGTFRAPMPSSLSPLPESRIPESRSESRLSDMRSAYSLDVATARRALHPTGMPRSRAALLHTNSLMPCANPMLHHHVRPWRGLHSMDVTRMPRAPLTDSEDMHAPPRPPQGGSAGTAGTGSSGGPYSARASGAGATSSRVAVDMSGDTEAQSAAWIFQRDAALAATSRHTIDGAARPYAGRSLLSPEERAQLSRMQGSVQLQSHALDASASFDACSPPTAAAPPQRASRGDMPRTANR